MVFFRRMAKLASRLQLDREIKAELRSHIEMRTEDNVAAGMPPDLARRDALLRFGNPTLIREKIVAVDAGLGVEMLLRDLRYALRQFQRNPTFAITVIGTIALGIAATVMRPRQLSFQWCDFLISSVSLVELSHTEQVGPGEAA
jgi:hypothetical protein